MELNDKIFVAWHRWLVWSAIVRRLESLWYKNIITKSHSELDLMDYNTTKSFFETEKPDYAFLAAAKVWWIVSNNTYPAEHIFNNLQIQNNVVHSAYLSWVKKLLLLWSSCIYPRDCPQPIKEEYLLTWELEKTNEPYAIAKIAWIKLCQSYNRQYGTNFISCMPTNLYGPNDNFDPIRSHVFPAMIRKFHEAKVNNNPSVTLWWDWSVYREFLHVDDMADGCIFMMNNFNPTPEQNERWEIFLNIWTWEDLTIKELAEKIKNIVWYKWEIVWDSSKPKWTPRKLLNVDKLKALWWRYQISLDEGIRNVYEWFLNNKYKFEWKRY